MPVPKPGLTTTRPGEVASGEEPDWQGGDPGHPYNATPAEDTPSGGGRRARHLRMYGGRGYSGRGSDEVNAQDALGARGPRAEGGAQDNLRADAVPPTPGQSATPAAATGQGMWKALWNRIAARREARGASSQSQASAPPVGRPVRLNPPKLGGDR